MGRCFNGVQSKIPDDVIRTAGRGFSRVVTEGFCRYISRKGKKKKKKETSRGHEKSNKLPHEHQLVHGVGHIQTSSEERLRRQEPEEEEEERRRKKKNADATIFFPFQLFLLLLLLS